MKKSLAAILALCTLLCTVLSACHIVPVEPPQTSPPDSGSPPLERPDSDSSGESISPEDEPIADLIISEVMPKNDRLYLGHDLDWIELYNPGEAPVDLSSWFLTDDTERPYRLPLAGYVIPAEGYLVISLDEAAPFHLSSLGETVSLTTRGTTVSSLTFGVIPDGCSFTPDGVFERATPGFANTEDGYLSYLDTITLPDLIISEVLSSNDTYLEQNGECYDLVEIRNRSDKPISLGSYTLSDKRSEPSRYVFPDVTLAPGEFYVVFCSGDTSLGENHASFKISASGETVYLSKDGAVSDLLAVPGDLNPDESFGRDGKRPSYLVSPTPGEANTIGYLNGIAAPTASHTSGLYDEPITLVLSGSDTIYYTLDGSRPTKDSAVYTEPIAIDGVTTVRTFCASADRSSALAAYTYVIGQTHDLPVVTVAIPQELLTGDAGILNHIEQSYEYEAVLTMIEDGVEKFSVPFGFRLHGNDSRKGAKQNFQLRFRSEYGAGKLEYPLFEDRPFEKYNSLLLKGGSEDYPRAMMRDELCTAIVDGTTALYAQAIKPCVLYLGGEYWGIYYFRERFNDDYVADHLGVSEESVDLLFSQAYVQCGSAEDYKAILKYVKNHDMTKTENYEYLCQKIDMLSLMDWYICRSYVGDKDLANVRFFRSVEADGKWRWMFFDLDWAIFHTTDKPITSTLLDNGKHTLILGALASEEGRDTFLRRYAELMETALNEEYIGGIIDSLESAIESEIERDRARWKQTVSRWENEVQGLRNYFKDGARDKRVLDDIQDYFGLTDAEMEEYFG